MNNLYLIGFMGAGKSTVAEAFEKDGWKRIEMDETISREAGMTIPEIFSKYGEEHFRKQETDLLRRLSKETDTIVSCGGGAAMREENVNLMKSSGKIVLLTASPEVILSRVQGNDDRPLLKGRMNRAGISELMEQRRPAYESAADLTVSTDGKTPEEIAAEIREKAFH